ncbi:MAG: GlsB/YeaQ/YmgE family stress response membrane protein [Hyphomicrobiales bacterium]|nr:MAG: GlsB/YeaQ/YmgE family stress response membrane protein [Hyphomicrobiales bacterium]
MEALLAKPGVGFFGMLLIGLIAGYVAEKATASDHGLFTNLLVGIAGSFVGGKLAELLSLQIYGFLGQLVVAIAGAVLLLFIWQKVVKGER